MSVGGRRIITMFEDDPPGSGISEVGAIVADDSLVLQGESVDLRGQAQSHKPGPTASSALAILSSLSPLSETASAVLEGLSEEELLDLLVAWDRVEGQAAAGKRAVAAAMEERLAPRIVPSRQGRVEVKGQAACEIAMRLGISSQRAGLLVGEGLLFNGVLADVGAALAEGLIDAGKAGLFAKVLGDQEAAVAFAVMDTLLPIAPGKPHAQLEKALNAELIRVDPAAAAKRFERAMRLRRLEQVQLRPDGMASIRLVGAVFDVARVYVHADGVARATKAAGDERTMDQLRADALVALVSNQGPPAPPAPPAAGADSDGPDGPSGPSWSDGLSGPSGSADPGDPGEPGSRLADPGSLSQISRLIAGLRAGSRHLKAKKGLPPSAPLIERPPLANATGPASKVTLLLALDQLRPPGDSPPSVAQTYRDELYAPPPDHQRPGAEATPPTPGDESLPREGMTPAADAMTPTAGAMPPAADALPSGGALPAAALGRDVPYLLGFGPIDPLTARALIADHPANLTIKIYEEVLAEHVEWLTAAPENRHDPCPALQRHLAAYYPTCIAPTCTVRATVCDNDHVIEYPLGPTHVTNLRPLCRYHHLLKTHAGHRLELDETGTLIWITALGTRRPTQHQRR